MVGELKFAAKLRNKTGSVLAEGSVCVGGTPWGVTFVVANAAGAFSSGEVADLLVHGRLRFSVEECNEIKGQAAKTYELQLALSEPETLPS